MRCTGRQRATRRASATLAVQAKWRPMPAMPPSAGNRCWSGRGRHASTWDTARRPGVPPGVSSCRKQRTHARTCAGLYACLCNGAKSLACPDCSCMMPSAPRCLLLLQECSCAHLLPPLHGPCAQCFACPDDGAGGGTAVREAEVRQRSRSQSRLMCLLPTHLPACMPACVRLALAWLRCLCATTRPATHQHVATPYALSFSGRGLPERLVPAEATRLLKHLGLREYANRACGSYSGGNRRKLSVAVALVGGAEVS